jgi:TatD DNase family protein
MTWIDSHVHLEDEAFAEDSGDVKTRALAAGVELMINAGSTREANCKILQNLPFDESMFAGMGLHPHEFPATADFYIDDLREQLSREKIVAVGEIGLDYHVFKGVPLPDMMAQQAAFRRQLRLARIFELPLIVHVREAYPDALRMLREEGPFPAGGVLHCYAGGPELLDEVMQMGFYIGVGGPVGYPSGDSVRLSVAAAPIDRIVLETDAPYLPPQSRRGLRNEPECIPEIARAVAGVRGVTLETLAGQTTANARRLFQLESAASDVWAYPLQNHMYVNLTNRCSANCIFCPRRVSRKLQAYDLTLKREPLAREIMFALGDVRKYSEVVFCGFGEPVLRLPVLLAVAREVKRQGVKVRVNTNGHADLIYNRDILPDCLGLVDEWSVSLNSADPEQYDRLVKPASGPGALAAVKQFIARAAAAGFEVTTTAVELPEVDIRAVEALSQQLGARYRGRTPQRLGEPEERD